MSGTLSTENKMNTHNSSQFDNMIPDTSSLSIAAKVSLYESKFIEIKKSCTEHASKKASIKTTESASQNVANFKLDEMTKKMKNEIFRIQEESRRHNESQLTENTKIENQINHIKEKCKKFSKALKEFLDRVQNLEKSLGIPESK
jgi:hypothetical protein